MSKNRLLHKIIVVGDGGVGKTSLRMRFLGEKFQSQYMMTIGADFSSYDMEIDGEYYSTLQLWDLAGQTRFSTVRGLFFKGAKGALLVFDLSNLNSFSNVKAWMNNVLTHAGDISVILVGNKSDLVDAREINSEEGQKLAKELNVPYIETSAKTGDNVAEAFTQLVLRIRDEFTTKLSKEELIEHRRKTGLFKLEEISNRIADANHLVAEGKKLFDAAEIYRRIADTLRLERDTSAPKSKDPMLNDALKYYELSAQTYLKAERYKEAAWCYDHLKSLQESIGDYKNSLQSFIQSAETYERAGNFPGAAWRYSAIGNIFESKFEFNEAHIYNLKSWETNIRAKEFALILEPLQKLSLDYERQRNYEKIQNLWLKSIDEAVKSQNYFWAGQLLEIYVNLYCSPEAKGSKREKTLEIFLKAAKKFRDEQNLSLESRSIIFAARTAIQLKDIEQAKKLYDKVLNYYSEAQIWHQAARISTILGKHEQAVKYYKKEVEENQEPFYEPYLYISQGEYYVLAKQHEKAADNFRRGLQKIKDLGKTDLPDWKQEELFFLQNWIEARIEFQEGIKYAELDNHTKAQQKYKRAIEKFEAGIDENISEERKNLLKGFISLCIGLDAFEEIQKLEERGNIDAIKKQRRLVNFNLSRANAFFIKASQFSISQLINSILEAVEKNEFNTAKTQAANVFPSFQPVSTQKISKLGLANAFLDCSIEELKPLQVEINDSCALSFRISIDNKYFNESGEKWLSLFLTCSDSIFSPISVPVTFTEQLTQFNHTFTPRFLESGETTIKVQVKDIEQTMALRSMVSGSIKVLKQFVPLMINLSIESDGESIYSSCNLTGPVTQKINPVKLKVKTSKLLELGAQIEYIALGKQSVENFKRVGKGLYEAIIPEKIRTELHSAIQFAISEKVPINLMINSSRNLMGVPFELFYSDDPSINGFLSAKFPLFRYPVEKKIMPIEKLTTRIGKVLLISANPLGGEFDLPNVDAENEKIKDLLTKIGVQAKMITSDQATLQNVMEELLVNEYEAIHFSGHGEFNPQNPMESGLVLGLKGKPTEYLTAANIKEILQESNLKLIFLNSCYSATQSSQALAKEEVLGIADAFIQVGVPTIIGMQWPITDQGALILSENFYEQVFRNNVDMPTALKLSRHQVMTKRPKDPSWACPMLVKHPSL